jgi:hypothetical protein
MLRQEYARPPRYRPPPGPAGPGRRSRLHRPAGINPPHLPGPGTHLPQQPSQPGADRARRRAQARNSGRSRAPATGWTPPGGDANPAIPPFPATAARRRKLLLQPALGTAGVHHRRPAPLDPYRAGLLPQVAGIGPVPVGVLWVSCKPLRVENPAAARDGGTSRDSGPRRISDTQPGTTRLHHQGDRNAPGPALTQPPRPRPAGLRRAPPNRAQPPVQPSSSASGTWNHPDQDLINLSHCARPDTARNPQRM